MQKTNKIVFFKPCRLLIMLYAIWLNGCNNGTTATSNPPTVEKSNSLEKYIGKLHYIPKPNNDALGSSLSSAIPSNQQGFLINESLTLSSIGIYFYTESNCVASSLHSIYDMRPESGSVTFLPGLYYSSNASNYYLCSQYNGGCSAEANEIASIGFMYNQVGGESTLDCLVNPANTMTNVHGGEVIANYSSTPTTCTSASAPCGFSESYLMYPNIGTSCAHTGCTIFVTESHYSSNLGGISGADTICQNEATGLHLLGKYKAFLTDFQHRRACISPNCDNGGRMEGFNWVMYPDTIYKFTNNHEAFITNESGVYVFGELRGTPPNTNIKSYYNGFSSSADWTTPKIQTMNCNQWTTNSIASSQISLYYDHIGVLDGASPPINRAASSILNGFPGACGATSFPTTITGNGLLCIEQ